MEGFACLLVGVLVLYFLVMPFIRGLRGEGEGGASPTKRRSERLDHDERILFHCAVHGESFYQENIRRIAAAGKTAELVPEPDNPHDANAVRVDVDGLTVGYIPRDQAVEAKNEEWKAIIAAVNSGSEATGVVLGITETYRRRAQ